MQRKDSRSTSRTQAISDGAPSSILLAVGILLAFCCAVGMLAMSSRMHFAIDYRLTPTVEPGFDYLEPFASSTSGFALVSCVVLCWTALFIIADWTSIIAINRSIFWMAVGQLPTLLWLFRSLGLIGLPAHAWESLWICLCFSWSMRWLVVAQPATRSVSMPSGVALAAMAIGTLLACWGWLHQTLQYHGNCMLGFNDFGHFLQRVANTAAGRGWLLETPVLPPFWDHFNPGLLLLVPLWWLFPSVTLVFLLQAASLAGSGLFIYLIARHYRASPLAALLFGLAWLAQPSLGQMNVAYTYGWHPITFAIPSLLGAVWALLSRQYVAATLATLLALSMEEGVFVLVGLTAATCVALRVLESRSKSNQYPAIDPDPFLHSLSVRLWCIVWFVALIGFVLVYRLSGLAEFQTGRFVALGNSLTEILLSPLLRPQAFWGQLLRVESLMFVLLLWLPCGLPTLARGWRWLIPTLLPLGVLIVWDHRPAHSLAFQYPSTLLPLFWLATLRGSDPMNSRTALADHKIHDDVSLIHRLSVANATSALTAGVTLSLFWGQLFYSGPTIIEVQAKTYGQTPIRQQADEDGRWLDQQLAQIRQQQAECLATGRIAAHLVGCRDIETVGQFIQRRDALARLTDRQPNPLLHYRWIVLDRREGFQQTPEETAQIEAQARAAGFETFAEQYDVVILSRQQTQ